MDEILALPLSSSVDSGQATLLQPSYQLKREQWNSSPVFLEVLNGNNIGKVVSTMPST